MDFIKNYLNLFFWHGSRGRHFQEENDNEPLTEIEKCSSFEEKDDEEQKNYEQQQGGDLGISTYDNVHRETLS